MLPANSELSRGRLVRASLCGAAVRLPRSRPNFSWRPPRARAMTRQPVRRSRFDARFGG